MLYVIFAVLATAVNLLTQEGITYINNGIFELEASIFGGTITGLIVKYTLDKKYIFNFVAENQAKNLMTFLIYGSMGIVTTLVFWVSEYTFDLIFETKTMRYVGAIIGLSIGYVAKYHLDKKFVFIGR